MAKFKYLQVVEDLERAIKRGVFQTRLPSIRRYATDHNLSMATVQKAYGQLELSGWVSAKPMQGFFINLAEANCYDYGKHYQQVATDSTLEQQVLYSLNDEQLFPLSSTAPSSLLNNGSQLAKLQKKAVKCDNFQYAICDQVQGLLPLRVTVAQHLFRYHAVCAPDDVVITSGRRESLLVALAACQCLGGCVAIESPSSFYFQAVVKRLCRDVVEIPMQADFEQELALLAKAHQQTAFAVYLVNPSFNDPTGRLLNEHDKLKLLAWAAKAKVILIEYDRGHLSFNGEKAPSLFALSAQIAGAQVISIQDFFDTISSRINLGFIVSNCRQQALITAKHTLTEEANLATQQLVNSLIASGEYEKSLAKLSYALQRNYLATVQLFRNHLPANVQYMAVQGGPCLWLKLNNSSSKTLWQHTVDNKVAIAPGAMFSFEQKFDAYFRVTFALPWNSAMESALLRLCKAIQQATP